MAALHELFDFSAGHVLNVRLARVEEVADTLADVESDDLESGTRELDGQRQTHVAQANDSYRGAAVGDSGENLLFHLGGWVTPMAHAIHILGVALPLDHIGRRVLNIDEATGQPVNTFHFGARIGHLPAVGGYIPA